jgi:hypothetical protein
VALRPPQPKLPQQKSSFTLQQQQRNEQTKHQRLHMVHSLQWRRERMLGDAEYIRVRNGRTNQRVVDWLEDNQRVED